MSVEKLFSVVSRLFFLGAFVLIGLAVMERVANLAGYTFEPVYQSGRLLEFAVVLLVFVITIQLREMKEGLRDKKP